MMHHFDYSTVQAAIADEPTWACVGHLLGMMADNPFPVADDRDRSPGEETIRDVLELHPGADPGLVRGYFNYLPEH
ncbi:MAG: hypothetical protein AB7Q00_13915 [Phycisphaerales bacterium]